MRFFLLEHAYGYDDVAIVPGEFTINPELAETKFKIHELEFEMPVLASAMDAVVSPSFAVEFNKKGGLAVLNLEGVYTKYNDYEDVLNSIISSKPEDSTSIMQTVYNQEISEELVAKRVQEIKSNNVMCAVSVTPQNTKRLSPIAIEAGADIIVVQSTVTTPRHFSRSITGLNMTDLKKQIKVPLIVGNCVSYNVALEFMNTGVDGILVGVGPGAACTTREVTGLGVPQVTATLNCSKARDDYFNETGRYVSIITDGGIRTGGDFCKSFASGADAVMIGTPLAQTQEAPGKGFNWGMATADQSLPRGTRVSVGTRWSLDTLLNGPSSTSDGTQNFMGALKNCMGFVGAYSIRDMHKAQMIVAPSIKTEGKFFQLGQ
ncbi:MAG: GuaB3 family IMP dehydrogenase-related protein [Chloroflexi bacterium]|nr:GuaB3 family IMP dehydrogenase-related protein [Chloroflexota bacterium]